MGGAWRGLAGDSADGGARRTGSQIATVALRLAVGATP
jgi:hypothetical protein